PVLCHRNGGSCRRRHCPRQG
ncbi:hypothetical protein E0H68_34330, partial [Rhizobium leguminosarum bv. viciae]